MMMGCTEYTMFVLTVPVRMSRPRDALQQFAYGTGIRIVYSVYNTYLSPPIKKSTDI